MTKSSRLVCTLVLALLVVAPTSCKQDKSSLDNIEIGFHIVQRVDVMPRQETGSGAPKAAEKAITPPPASETWPPMIKPR